MYNSDCFHSFYINSSHATGLILYLLKGRCFDVFRWYRKIAVAQNGLIFTGVKVFTESFGLQMRQ